MKAFAAALYSLLCLTLFTREALADNKDWVDRPLSLPYFHAAFDAALAFGQYAAVQPDGTFKQQLGGGSNLEAGVGLPVLGEVRVRTGYGFGDGGRAQPPTGIRADYYGRLFDHETAVYNTGGDPWANPEITLGGSLFDSAVFGIGLQTRFMVPLADHTYFAATPSLPIRIRVPGYVRIDTGIYIPVGFQDGNPYSISVPAAVWIQVDQWFFGPMSGVRFNHLVVPNPAGNGTVGASQTDVTAGFGAGYTLGGGKDPALDIKAQLYTPRINDANWTKTIGGGFGVGLLIP